VHNNLVDQKAPVQVLGLKTLSKGCCIGLEDRIFNNVHYSINVECSSSKGTIYIITGKKLQLLEKMTRIWQQVM
jgi:hypothetical protein